MFFSSLALFQINLDRRVTEERENPMDEIDSFIKTITHLKPISEAFTGSR